MACRKQKQWTSEVIQAAKSASVAMAEFWDALRQFEEKNVIEFEGTTEMISSLASEHEIPPSIADLSDETVITHLNEMPVDSYSA
jgi:hypothetical protein